MPEEPPRSRDAVPDGVREAGRRDSSLHDLAVVMARRHAGVRLLGGPIECDPHGGREPVTETRELLLVLLPGLDEVVLGERVENDLEVHAAYDLAFCDPGGQMVPTHGRRLVPAGRQPPA